MHCRMCVKLGNYLLTAVAVVLPVMTGLGADVTNSSAQAWAALTNFSLPTLPMEWQTNPPTEALVLRATIKQSTHDFNAAISDLDLALRSARTDAQAWVTLATILTVQGRFPEARRACMSLIRLSPELVSVTAAANVAALTGDADNACRLVENALDRNASADVPTRRWALTLLAETSARRGRPPEAERYFRQAFALGQRDAYLLGAYADFLLDTGAAQRAAALLKDETRADGLLLRLALAERARSPQPPSLPAHLANLRERFEALRLRGDTVHQREEARFALHLLHDPKRALALADANWAVQREPADVRILLEAAVAAGSRVAARPVLEFVKTNRLEDVRLASLEQQLPKETAP